MLTEHIKEALSQVKELQRMVMERQHFRGYSGWARIVSGTLALIASAIMASRFYPQNTRAHILGWGALFVVALVLNGAALVYWFFHDPKVGRDIARLKPLFDSLPALAVGGALTAAMLMNDTHQYLFGIWMCMFGLSNLGSRYVLPRMIMLVGIFYIVSGIAWLLAPSVDFLNPLPMGIVFFAGEWAGGLILHMDERRYILIERYQDEHEKGDAE